MQESDIKGVDPHYNRIKAIGVAIHNVNINVDLPSKKDREKITTEV